MSTIGLECLRYARVIKKRVVVVEYSLAKVAGLDRCEPILIVRPVNIEGFTSDVKPQSQINTDQDITIILFVTSVNQ
jgi:uncharacterized protein YacL